jgi:hypothetical protein
MRQLPVALAALLFLHPAVGSAHSAAEAVTVWNQAVEDALVASPQPNPPPLSSPAFQARAWAMSALAMHNALNAISRQYASYPYPDGSSDAAAAGASEEAAVDEAAYRVLASIFNPSANPLFTNGRSVIDATYAAQIALVAGDDGFADGQALGASVAAKFVAMRTGDGVPGPGGYTPGAPAPGVFQGFGSNYAMPHLGAGKPFMIQSSVQFAPEGPYDLTSGDYEGDYNEVKEMGMLGPQPQANWTERQKTAHFWFEPTPRTFNRAVRWLAQRDGTSARYLARAVALSNMASVDSAITCFQAKYTINFWRPIEAIHWLDDGNAETAPDPNWQPEIATPNHPEYPSGHSSQSSAFGHVLDVLFPNAGQIEFTSTTGPGVRTLSSFEEAVVETSESRIFAGAHFRKATIDGENLGKQVAKWGVKRFLQPRP